MRHSAIAVALFLLFSMPAAADEAIRIVVVTHGQAVDPFWSVVKKGVDKAAADMKVTVEYRAPDQFDMVAMARYIDAAVASNPKGLVVSIPDKDALSGPIMNAIASGIPVISINSGGEFSESLGILTHIGQSEYDAGVVAGKRLRRANVSSAICVNHEQGNTALDERCSGFKNGLGVPVEVLSTGMDPTKIKNAVAAYLTRNANVNGILTVGPFAADYVVAAVDQVGRTGAVKIATFDMTPSVLAAIKAGKINFALDQQQFLQGYMPVVLLSNHARYGVAPWGMIHTGPGYVTKTNVDQFVELTKQGYR